MKTTSNWNIFSNQIDSDKTIKRIKFKCNIYLLIVDAITTRYAFENFLPSYAHLFPDGRILRHGKQIGTKEDIEIIETTEKNNA